MINNIFKFATKELSQDAFICWLVNCLNTDESNQNIKKIAQNFLMQIANDAKKGELKKIILNKDRKIEIYQQHNKIDILLLVYSKKDRSDKYAIIIEDKVDTNEHDCQIERYKIELQGDKDSKIKTDENNIVTCYYKIFDESHIEEKNVDSIFSREKMQKLLSEYTENDIQYINDYKNYLAEFDKCIKEKKNSKDFFSDFNFKNINHCNFFKDLEKEMPCNKKIYWGHTSVGGGETWWCNMPIDMEINTEDKKFDKYAFLKLNLEKNEGIYLRISKIEEDEKEYAEPNGEYIIKTIDKNGKIRINKHKYSYDPIKYNSLNLYNEIEKIVDNCIKEFNSKNNCSISLKTCKRPSKGYQKEINIFKIDINSLKNNDLYEYNKIKELIKSLKKTLEKEVKYKKIKLDREKREIVVEK